MKELSKNEILIKKFILDHTGLIYFVIFNEEGIRRYGSESHFQWISPDNLVSCGTVKQVYQFRNIIPK